jgi:hypothetical protein
MISAVRAAPKSGFHGVRLGCGDIHALKRCFILTISPALYLFLEMPIKSKTTSREQDRADLVRLRDLLELKHQRGDAVN